MTTEMLFEEYIGQSSDENYSYDEPHVDEYNECSNEGLDQHTDYHVDR